MQAAVGRAFEQPDAEPGRGYVVCLGDGLWRRHYGADPAIIGTEIRLEGRPFTVIGVLPPDFRVPDREGRRDDIDVWGLLAPDVTFSRYGAADRAFTTRNLGSLPQVIGRLSAGVTVQDAQAEMQLIAQRVAREHRNNPQPWSVRVTPLHQAGTEDIRSALWLFMGAVARVLLIACGNVSGLLLARSVERRNEISVRLSLGASRARLVGQMLMESLVLSTLGGFVGVSLTVVALRALPRILPVDLPQSDAIALNLSALGFTCAW